jgi:hypothetical protein
MRQFVKSRQAIESESKFSDRADFPLGNERRSPLEMVRRKILIDIFVQCT